jgi:hypothetical protein
MDATPPQLDDVGSIWSRWLSLRRSQVPQRHRLPIFSAELQMLGLRVEGLS